jgi:hypothetical protein
MINAGLAMSNAGEPRPARKTENIGRNQRRLRLGVPPPRMRLASGLIKLACRVSERIGAATGLPTDRKRT